MQVVFHRKVQRFVVSVKDSALREIIQARVDAIIQDPSTGKLLEHPFKKYHIQVVRFTYKENRYRIAYTVVSKKKEMVFLLIDKRKDFYEKLQRML